MSAPEDSDRGQWRKTLLAAMANYMWHGAAARRIPAVHLPGRHLPHGADQRGAVRRRGVLLLPTVQDAGFKTLSLILFAMLAVSGLVGVIFAPDTQGRELEETQTAPTGRRRVGLASG